MMSILFESVKIKNMELRNRFVRSATYDGCSDKTGGATGRQIKLFTDLARGGVGLMITGVTYVHKSGQISPFQNSMESDKLIPGFKKLTDAVHGCGAKIAVQLFHAGRDAWYVKSKNLLPIAPSFIETDPYFNGKYRAMTEDEIREIIETFGDGARRAREAGFDAVQIHGAHAYLLSQFLSPQSNRRADQWGGNLENRLRIHREIYHDIRQKVGEDYPLLIKIGVQDGFDGGLEFREGKRAAIQLAGLGFDALEISQGLRGKKYEGTEWRPKINRADREAYFRHWTREIKAEVDVPVMMVGGLRTFKVAEEVVEKGETDFVSLCRPLIRNPWIINDWKRGDHRRSGCISCNKCLEALFKGMTLQCILKNREKENSAATET